MKVLPPDILQADALSTAASGMAAQRTRMTVLANNLANMNTTRNAKGEFAPFLRKEVLFKTAEINQDTPDEQGVLVHQIVSNEQALRRIHDPNHPEADEKGYRLAPRVGIAHEMSNFIEASRAYEANLNSMKTASSATKRTVEILEGPKDQEQ